MYGIKPEIMTDLPNQYFCLDDYEKVAAKWCPGCGDHAVLGNVQKLCRDEQLDPAKTVFVSGIGCSSRFPHYMKTSPIRRHPPLPISRDCSVSIHLRNLMHRLLNP